MYSKQAGFSEARSFSGNVFEVTEYHGDIVRTTSYRIDQAEVSKAVRNEHLTGQEQPQSTNTGRTHGAEAQPVSDMKRMRRSDYVQMLFVTDGLLHLDIEDRHLTLQKGDVCFISPHTRFREIPSEGCRLCRMKADLRQAGGMIRRAQTVNETYTPLFAFLVRNAGESKQADYLDFTPLHREGEDTEELLRLLSMIIRETEEHRGGYFELIWGATERIFANLEDPARYYCSGAVFNVDETDDLYDRLLAYMHTHRVRLTRETLSAEFGYTGGYLNQVFRRYAHESIASYNREICLKEAADRLLNSEESVSKIIRGIGYTSRASFYRLFQGRYGVTPEEYRKSTARRV